VEVDEQGANEEARPSAAGQVSPVENLMRRLLPPHVDVTAYPEYELRHPTGQVDTFTDIGDASDFRDQFFPTSRLFRREVTSVEIRSPWTQVDLEEQPTGNVVAFGKGDEA
jgi:hypothetical protein